MTAFIIVGRGLAANVLAHTLYSRQIPFRMVGNETLSNCSMAAAGIWNPVVFKRLTGSWLAREIVPFLIGFYSECEITMGKKLITLRPIIKPFTENQEKTLWQKKSQTDLSGFLDPVIHYDIPSTLRQCRIPNGYGIVEQAGNLDVQLFLRASSAFFKQSIIDETFDHSMLKIMPESVLYKGIAAKQIVFCEGHLVSRNPYFKWIPLKPAKGEVLTIRSETLALKNSVFNKDGFLMDTGDHTFKTGSTYEWKELSDQPTEQGARELNDKLNRMISCEYDVIKREAGIRPSSIDRRPIIGPHPLHKNLFVFNGLGAKGVMLAPLFAGKFVNCCLHQVPLDIEVQIQRFYQFYEDYQKT